VAVVKPRPDIYTVLLGISLTAILLGILCLALELSRYNWDYKAEAVRLRAQLSPQTAPMDAGPAESGSPAFVQRVSQQLA